MILDSIAHALRAWEPPQPRWRRIPLMHCVYGMISTTWGKSVSLFGHMPYGGNLGRWVGAYGPNRRFGHSGRILAARSASCCKAATDSSGWYIMVSQIPNPSHCRRRNPWPIHFQACGRGEGEKKRQFQPYALGREAGLTMPMVFKIHAVPAAAEGNVM